MMETDYIEPGTYRDEQGTEVDVSARPDGRYDVDYGDGIKAGFCAATIRKCYPIAVAAAVLAMCGTAFAASGPTGATGYIGTPATIVVAHPASKALLVRAGKLVLADVKRTMTGANDPLVGLTYSKATCKGTVRRIVCVATTLQTMGGPVTETVLVRHGKLVGQGVVA